MMPESEDVHPLDLSEDELFRTSADAWVRYALRERSDDLRKLTDRECQLVRMRYGLAGDRRYSLEGVASTFGITEERAQQMLTRIIRKLYYARYGAGRPREYDK